MCSPRGRLIVGSFATITAAIWLAAVRSNVSNYLLMAKTHPSRAGTRSKPPLTALALILSHSHSPGSQPYLSPYLTARHPCHYNQRWSRAPGPTAVSWLLAGRPGPPAGESLPAGTGLSAGCTVYSQPGAGEEGGGETCTFQGILWRFSGPWYLQLPGPCVSKDFLSYSFQVVETRSR